MSQILLSNGSNTDMSRAVLGLVVAFEVECAKGMYLSGGPVRLWVEVGFSASYERTFDVDFGPDPRHLPYACMRDYQLTCVFQ
jgi:hypothetical protein